MRYYRIILSLSIFALFLSLFSASKILAVEPIIDPSISEVQTATTNQTLPPETKKTDTILDKIKSFFGNFIDGFFAKQFTISVENPASLTDYGNVNSKNELSASARSSSYQAQINHKNQYLKDIVTGENAYENLTLSSCSDDPNNHSVTLRELAAYQIKYNKITFNFSSADEIQKKDDLLLEYKDTFDKFEQLSGRMYDSTSSSDKDSLSTKEKVSFCYDQFYDQLWNIPQGNSGKSAAGSQQTNENLRTAIPDQKQQDPTFDPTNTDNSIKYLDDNKAQKESLEKFMTPEGFTVKGLINLRPDGWQ